MNIPENIKEMQDAIRKYDLEIEDAIKNEPIQRLLNIAESAGTDEEV